MGCEQLDLRVSDALVRRCELLNLGVTRRSRGRSKKIGER